MQDLIPYEPLDRPETCEEELEISSAKTATNICATPCAFYWEEHSKGKLAHIVHSWILMMVIGTAVLTFKGVKCNMHSLSVWTEWSLMPSRLMCTNTEHGFPFRRAVFISFRDGFGVCLLITLCTKSKPSRFLSDSAWIEFSVVVNINQQYCTQPVCTQVTLRRVIIFLPLVTSYQVTIILPITSHPHVQEKKQRQNTYNPRNNSHIGTGVENNPRRADNQVFRICWLKQLDLSWQIIWRIQDAVFYTNGS